jgi:hypothetical protein
VVRTPRIRGKVRGIGILYILRSSQAMRAKRCIHGIHVACATVAYSDCVRDMLQCSCSAYVRHAATTRGRCLVSSRTERKISTYRPLGPLSALPPGNTTRDQHQHISTLLSELTEQTVCTLLVQSLTVRHASAGAA